MASFSAMRWDQRLPNGEHSFAVVKIRSMFLRSLCHRFSGDNGLYAEAPWRDFVVV